MKNWTINVGIYLMSSFLLIGCSVSDKAESKIQNVITTDVDNFWKAYDKITSTEDSLEQMKYLQTLYLNKATPGLTAIMEARQYQPEEYIAAINQYPKFWQSIRKNTNKAKSLGEELNKDINQLRALYPDLKPAKVYFTVGVFRTGGTTMDSLVLIGSEIAMADKNVVTTEFPKHFEFLKKHFATNPIDQITFLNTHEFVHTQQKSGIGSNLLTQCLREGVAEFVVVTATGKPSTTPAIDYGKKNSKKVKQRFLKEMFNGYYRYWLWSNYKNEFNTRDLGYYLGYDMARHYYDSKKDKPLAIKRLIELDYNDDETVAAFIDEMTYFDESIRVLKQTYQKHQPIVTGIEEFENGAKNVNSNIKQMTIEFSTEMDERFRGFDIGPLGEDYLMSVTKFIGFSEDRKKATFEVDLKPKKRYQLVISNGFSSMDGVELADYLIEIWTD